jgi:hypothetical protein
MQLQREHNQPSDQQVKREVLLCFELADLYKKLIGKKKFPHASLMMIECYKNATALNNASAHYQLGVIFLEEGKFRQSLESAITFSSEMNQRKCNQAYEEAHAHLLAGEKLEHVGAKRLRGLAIINGWGATADKDAGFALVVDSIDQEGSWEKVPQIFASMGLNKPEFFAAIMQRRKINL